MLKSEYIYQQIVLGENIPLLTLYDISTPQSRRIILLQKRAIQIVNGSKHNSHNDPHFKAIKIIQFQDLYDLECCKLHLKSCRNTLSHYLMNELETKTANIHVTRQRDELFVPLVRSKLELQLIAYKIAKAWNNLPTANNTKKGLTFQSNPLAICTRKLNTSSIHLHLK